MRRCGGVASGMKRWRVSRSTGHNTILRVPSVRRSAPAGSHSGRGGLRLRLVSERNRFPSSRRRREPIVGRVGRRVTGGANASRRTAARRCLAAVRFSRWERCSEALMVSTVPESRPASRSRARSRWTSLRAVVVPRSRLSCTRESAVLTPWPPGPDDRENCSTSSPAGIRRPPGAPGPGGTCRSSTRLLSRNSDAIPWSGPVGSSQGSIPGFALDGVRTISRVVTERGPIPLQ